MAETFIFSPAGEEDLSLGWGPFTSLLPDGTTATLHEIGIQSVLGAAFLNADDQEGGTAGDQIDAADAVLADGIGVIVLPPTMASGEGTALAATTTLFDFRGTAEGEGFRFNLSSEVIGDTRSKLYIGDNYDAIESMMVSRTLAIIGAISNPEDSNGTFNGIDVQYAIESQSDTFAGVMCGISGVATADATNGSPQATADLRGGSFQSVVGGNTSVTRAWSLLAKAPTNDGSGTLSDAVAFVAEAVDSGSSVNLSILSSGYTELVGSTGIGILPNPDVGLLIADSFDFSLFVSGLSEFEAPIGIGVAPNVAVGLTIVDPGLTGSSEYGMQIAVLSSTEAISAGVGLISQCDTAVGSFTQAANYSIYAANPTKGAGSTITTLYGVYIEDMTVGGTNYGLYSAHTGESVFSGRVSGTTHRLTGATPTTGIAASEIGLGRSTATSIGSNGGASAPTANPVKYLKINEGGTVYQIALYNIA